ncbi:Methyltransferase type 11 [Kribbella flavida DSM 17836]|uniref:Methyltransferase type 11 n=1 Tax=Kribbella flavida (strain DSM 17836 / JCM 10339 / NBRC 14399) TaxID=479435 RepID=D2PQP8_KRIFD|nr:class I SAM-dependent methyltransferase [Kribbella flavida]ADB31031.1 Methyltransferase type 11 [Kribbella flavida DSM 17836]
MDPKEVVRRGYDVLSHRYRADDAGEADYAPWIAGLLERLPERADVLDLGCGNGVPMARALVNAGHAVTGVDLSEVQVERARRLVPRASFLQGDATAVEFPTAAFDAVVCLYALIHVPLDEQQPLVRRVAGWLRPGGSLLATTGDTAWTGSEQGWLGGDATMWWSHADRATYRAWFTAAGLEVVTEGFQPEGDSGHAVFWCRKS